MDGAETLLPVRLKFLNDTLFVTYVGKPRIDLFTPDLNRITTLHLTDPEPVVPASFDLSDSSIFVVDHGKHVIVQYDRMGRYVTSFGTLPDGETQLSPLAANFYGGVLYVSDIGLKQVLAISMTDAGEITQQGELILQIPTDTTRKIGLPSSVFVTFDGRLLVADAAEGLIRVFTCDGNFIYDFDSIVTAMPMAPQGFALDHVIDSSMIDSSSFDPSGIRNSGRLHIVDSNNGRIHMFNILGRFVASYPSKKLMEKPSSIAIDTRRQNVYIADPGSGKLFLFNYGALQ
jgi:hypothetical protein